MFVNINKVIIIEYFETAYGELILGVFEEKLCLCDWRYRVKRDSIDQRIKNGLNASFLEGSSKILDLTKRQLTEYFNNERSDFDLPLMFIGSEFQESVWNALLSIPYGISKTYKALSIELGNVDAIRAVASANGANAISIIVPCHRIIGSNGELIGYAGGINSKKKLLSLENSMLNNQYNLF